MERRDACGLRSASPPAPIARRTRLSTVADQALGRLKMPDRKMTDQIRGWKMTGPENYGPTNRGWKCKICRMADRIRAVGLHINPSIHSGKTSIVTFMYYV